MVSQWGQTPNTDSMNPWLKDMPINIYIMNASGKFTPIQDRVRKIARQTVNKVKKQLPINNVDIVFKVDYNGMLKDVDGVGGFSPSDDYVQIALDFSYPNLKKTLEKSIERTLIHELHHTQRYKAKQFGKTLFEFMVSEGLADNFVFEITGNVPKWANALTNRQKIKLLQKAKSEMNKNSFSYEDWFIHGSKKRDIPKWAGYSLGFELVQEYLEKHSDISAAKLVKTPAKIIK